MGRLLTPDRLAQDPDGAILEDVTIKGASTRLTALSLTPHALALVAELPVLEIVSSVHMICDLTLGKVLLVYLVGRLDDGLELIGVVQGLICLPC